MSDNMFQDWRGRSVSRQDIVTPRLLAEFHATLSPFLFAQPDTSLAPPGLHWGLAPATPTASDTAPDGSEAKGILIPPIPHPRRMWAGGRIETLAPLCEGDQVTRVSTLVDISQRQGASGTLWFVSLRHDIFRGTALTIRERQDLVFREAGTTAASGRPAPRDDKALVWTITPSPLLLFRFSALTFNGHRIHYDEPYCREEGYSGLLVHGPLQAALMMNQMATYLGHVPEVFDYRCLAPLTSGPDFRVMTGEDHVARVVRHDGIITAEGRVPARGT